MERIELGKYRESDPKPKFRITDDLFKMMEVPGGSATNNVTAIGQSVPMHTGESYDGPGTALVPAVRMEDFYMTSVSPAV